MHQNIQSYFTMAVSQSWSLPINNYIILYKMSLLLISYYPQDLLESIISLTSDPYMSYDQRKNLRHFRDGFPGNLLLSCEIEAWYI